MCFECNSLQFNRRSLLKFAGVAGVAAMTAGFGLPALASDAALALSPDEALAKLQEGNRKFVADAEACAADISKRRQDVAKSQAPWAIVLTCSDSRVVPELVFGGVTLGELFVARNRSRNDVILRELRIDQPVDETGVARNADGATSGRIGAARNGRDERQRPDQEQREYPCHDAEWTRASDRAFTSLTNLRARNRQSCGCRR